ncbi:MAG TPA: DUF2314 domain-containing protein [Verrucomicrobiales bacterium]|nr:DUF2314 domain-containing protein [Verrucomicrobiales bacterium]
MSEPVFMFDGQDPQMQQAYAEAQRSFKNFWRELSWERRRIVPGLDLAIVKLPFTDGPRRDGNPEYEHMWVGEVDFDGLTLHGQLLNAPNWLTSVEAREFVRVPFSHLEDWMMTANGQAYGGYTVNLMRARMGHAERQQHDNAWGLDFGDPSSIRLEIRSNPKAPPPIPGVFQDHPMCVNMLPKIEEQLRQDAGIAHSKDESGWTLLHSEALAGNFGADLSAKTPDGRDAAALARGIGWNEIADYLGRAGAG